MKNIIIRINSLQELTLQKYTIFFFIERHAQINEKTFRSIIIDKYYIILA